MGYTSGKAVVKLIDWEFDTKYEVARERFKAFEQTIEELIKDGDIFALEAVSPKIESKISQDIYWFIRKRYNECMQWIGGMQPVRTGTNKEKMDSIAHKVLGYSIYPYEFLVDYYEQKYFEKLEREKEKT